MEPELEETSFAERVVLLGVSHLERADETPVNSATVVETCTWRFGDAGDDLPGRVSESDVIRALNRLEDRGLVREIAGDDDSPVGKGRPQYELAGDIEAVLDALAADDRVGALARRIRDDDV